MQPSPQDGDSPTNDASRSPSPGSKRAASEITDCDPEGGVKMTVENGDASKGVDDQVAQVSALMTRPLKNGQKGYVISMKWLRKVFARSSTHFDRADKESQESELGPVDNSDLALDIGPEDADLKDEEGEPFLPMRPGLQRGQDYEIVPFEAWDLIMQWYGLTSGTPVITRFAYDTSPYAQPKIEYNINPPIVTIFKLSNPYAGMTPQLLREKNTPSVKMLAGSETNFMKWLKMAKQKAGVDMATKVRVWKINGGIPSANASNVTTPAVSRAPSPAPPLNPSTHTNLLVDLNTFLNLSEGTHREALQQIKDQTNNPNYNGKMTLKMAGLVDVNTVVLDEQVAKGEWASEVSAKALKKLGIPVEIPAKKEIKETTVQSNGTPVPLIAPAPPARKRHAGKRPPGDLLGFTGLSNLGNTCYMNAATQCIRAVEELSIYFLAKKHKDDLNCDNVLGHGGLMAKTYADLVESMYAKSNKDAVTPRRWKAQVGHSNHTFHGYQQHDSQEFLMFALDALSEDLDRILKKPYIEKPDSTDEMVHNRQALEEFAKKSWDIYKARNDSVITDLFAGMYKSTLICPTCDKVSIMFDPFSSLTLPIPQESPILFREIIFMSLDSPPTRRTVEVNRTASMAEFMESVSVKTGVPSSRLIGANVTKSSFWRVYDEPDMPFEAARIQTSDVVTVMEVDTPPSEERILISLFHRASRKGGKPKGRVEREMFACPTILSFTPQEARDLEAIYRKILKHVATMTTLDILNVDGDHVIVDAPTPDDAAKPDDSSKPDAPEEAQSQSSDEDDDDEFEDEEPTHPLASSIPARLLELFDVKYLSTKEQIPRGRLVDTVKNYPLLTSRIQPPRNHSENSSADDISETPSVSDRSDSSTLGEQELPLIQQGEAILLDWNTKGRLSLFSTKKNHGPEIGEPTYLDPQSVHDPELIARRAEVAQRQAQPIELDDCLQEFGKTEVLSKTDAWYCPRCKDHVQARKKFELWSAPDILVVHLKRFTQGTSGRGYARGDKLKMHVNFPLADLDLSNYITGPSDNKSLEYDLFAVDCHSGSLNYGHYYAYAKNWVTGDWCEFNGMSSFLSCHIYLY